jgi:hypothetical protein
MADKNEEEEMDIDDQQQPSTVATSNNDNGGGKHKVLMIVSHWIVLISVHLLCLFLFVRVLACTTTNRSPKSGCVVFSYGCDDQSVLQMTTKLDKMNDIVERNTPSE